MPEQQIAQRQAPEDAPAKNPSTAMVRVDPHEMNPFVPRNLDEAMVLARNIAQSELVPPHLAGKPYDVFVVLQYGHDIGLTPIQAVFNIDMVKGKPRLNAMTTIGLVKRNRICKYFQLVESTDRVATFETHRVGNPRPTQMSFTIDDATTAGLTTGGSNDAAWKRHPKTMLRRRAGQLLAREEYPDVVGGATMDDDEIDELVALEARNHPTPPPPPPVTRVPNDRPVLDVTSTPAAAQPSSAAAPAPSSPPEEKKSRSAGKTKAQQPAVAPKDEEPKPNGPEDVGFRPSSAPPANDLGLKESPCKKCGRPFDDHKYGQIDQACTLPPASATAPATSSSAAPTAPSDATIPKVDRNGPIPEDFADDASPIDELVAKLQMAKRFTAELLPLEDQVRGLQDDKSRRYALEFFVEALIRCYATAADGKEFKEIDQRMFQLKQDGMLKPEENTKGLAARGAAKERLAPPKNGGAKP